ncbi:putative ATPase/DNA-binding SARP family transcriptional activator [Nonomuraea roseoviolacea subsp. carminata]|uniref:ATPase/DNA-binding SARP family transcriptional activator n=1 Tax=Nonomuraea roseoviolacea subsp. carminata TaxID=160689 RepID=A0ABT1K582_9ACTN|nr:BTAD domain-containing putative transcriptional regulator [Nonomuraea roseoviolacea]MCP2348757.1 putative ATPase/DNA-binding SARP family transcriptional activator [Nonomuraea roseoviolacea subsp. carminata]
MRFGVLGPLAVWTPGGEPVRVPEAKVRALLADLLAHRGTPVSTDRLVLDLWGGQPPAGAPAALRVKVSQLRRVLGDRELIVHQARGYVLKTGPAREVDADRFEDLLGRARQDDDPRGRRAKLDEALGLWRGPAYAGYRDEEFTRAETVRLDELRLVALEELAAARLALGEHGPVAADLAGVVTEHPLRERLRALHLRALYGAGRQGEALASYADLRTRLAEELGADPGPELVALHQAILRHDPSLDIAPTRETRPPADIAPTRETRPPADIAPTRETRPPADIAPTPRTTPPSRSATTPETMPPSGSAISETPRSSAGAMTQEIREHQGARSDLGVPRSPGVSEGASPLSPVGGLPAPLSSLVGRAEAVAEVRGLLRANRLVTLTGPGGVGKTRLALEVAAAPGRPFPGGVWMVELAASAPAEVAEAVAGALGLRDDVPGSLADRLAAALRSGAGAGETLLVLDNCEHVVEEVAALAGRLLRAVPGLRILATSRESLRVPGEALWSVPPLSVAAAVELLTSRAGMPATAMDATTATATTAAHSADDPDDADAPNDPNDPNDAADADYADDERSALVEICVRLDGIPLALELAATRLRALTPRGLADRLDDRFRVLAPGLRGAPARQRTLRAVIDWSWELLGEEERLVLRRLAVHAGGCTLEAAEAVCGEPGLDVLGPLSLLVDRSLVVRSADGRYRLLESVAAYCLERLAEAGELDAVRMRHVRHHAGLAERAEPSLYGHEQRRVLTLLDAERANVRAAIDHAVRLGAAGEAVRLVNALAWYWVLRGRLGEGRRALEAALSVAAPDTPGAARARLWLHGLEGLAGRPVPLDTTLFEAVEDPVARARARWFAGLALFGYDDLAAGMELVESALTACEALDDRWGTAAALSVRARWAGMRGDLAALRRDGERALALFQESGDRWGEMRAAESLGTLAEITGDYGRAAALRRDGLRMAEELGLWGAACDALSRLGRIAMLTGDHAAAEEHHERARALAVSQSNRPAEQFAEVGLALGARRQGRLDEADRLLRKWIGWVREVSGAPGEALILAELGFVAELRGDAAAARELQLGALARARHVGDPRAVALALEGLAGARALAGEHAEAARLLGKAAALRDSAGAPLPPAERGDVDRVTAAARAALGGTAFAAALALGAASPLDGLVPQPA